MAPRIRPRVTAKFLFGGNVRLFRIPGTIRRGRVETETGFVDFKGLQQRKEDYAGWAGGYRLRGRFLWGLFRARYFTEQITYRRMESLAWRLMWHSLRKHCPMATGRMLRNIRVDVNQVKSRFSFQIELIFYAAPTNALFPHAGWVNRAINEALWDIEREFGRQIHASFNIVSSRFGSSIRRNSHASIRSQGTARANGSSTGIPGARGRRRRDGYRIRGNADRGSRQGGTRGA